MTSLHLQSIFAKHISCRAAVQWKYGKPYSIETIEVAPPQSKEVRVKVVASGICHTDLLAAEGGMPALRLPFVPGHEGAGIIESIGPQVTSVKIGDKVLCMAIPQCKMCKYCLRGNTNVCLDQWGDNRLVPFVRSIGFDGKSRFSCNGKPVYHVMGSSSFSEYVVIPESSCVKVNENAPLETVCIIACGFSTGYGASFNLVDIRPEDRVAVWGLGGVGLSTVIGCTERGAKRIIGIDINSSKESIARQMGCTDFINPTMDDVQALLQKLTVEEGLDFAFCCGGGTKVIESAVESVGIQGTVVTVTIPRATEVASLPAASFSARRTIKGALLGGYRVQDDLPKLVDDYMSGKFPSFDRLVTHRIPLDKINEGMEMVRNGKCIKTVIML